MVKIPDWVLFFLFGFVIGKLQQQVKQHTFKETEQEEQLEKEE